MFIILQMPPIPLVQIAPSNASILSTYSKADQVPAMSDGSVGNITVFDDTACGEPMRPQRLLIDFTPNKEDSDFVQKKICAFWKFIANTPEIKNLRVLPVTFDFSSVCSPTCQRLIFLL